MSELPTTSSYSHILDKLAAEIRATGIFKPAARIEPAPGPLSENWLQKNALPHGGALPAIAGLAGVDVLTNGMKKHQLNMGLYFIPAPANRARQASDLADDVSAIVNLIEGNRWGLAGTGKPDKLRASNRYSVNLDKQGTSLWTIDWTQTFYLEGHGQRAERLGLVLDAEERGQLTDA
ncbi:MAG: hypothetical protein AAFQ10_03415 [Pseudomonadota bacterium]